MISANNAETLAKLRHYCQTHRMVYLFISRIESDGFKYFLKIKREFINI